MTKKEAEQRLKILKQQLILMNLYAYKFKEKYGVKGVEKRTNAILDEMILLLKIIKQYEK